MKIFYTIMLSLGLITIGLSLVLILCFPFLGIFALLISSLWTQLFYKNAKIYEANSI